METETTNPVPDSDDELLSVAIPRSQILREKRLAETRSGFDNDDLDLFAIAGVDPDSKSRKPREYRYYNLTARSIDETITETDLISTLAFRRRNEYRKQGYKVDLVETVCSAEPFQPVDTEIHYNPQFPVPAYVEPVNKTRRYNPTNTAAIRQRDRAFQQENNRLRKIAEQNQNNKCFVHSKSTGEMIFAGTPLELNHYLLSLHRKGMLDLTQIIVSIPASIKKLNRG